MPMDPTATNRTGEVAKAKCDNVSDFREPMSTFEATRTYHDDEILTLSLC
jgi:hypothetical protein